MDDLFLPLHGTRVWAAWSKENNMIGRTSNGGVVRDSAAFACFSDNTLTVDFKKLGEVHSKMNDMVSSYAASHQRAMDACRSAQGEVTRANNEVAVLKQAIASLSARLDLVEGKVDIDAILTETNKQVEASWFTRWMRRG
jgi:hypothetical protein